MRTLGTLETKFLNFFQLDILHQNDSGLADGYFSICTLNEDRGLILKKQDLSKTSTLPHAHGKKENSLYV